MRFLAERLVRSRLLCLIATGAAWAGAAAGQNAGRLYAGKMDIANFSLVKDLPLPAAVDQKFCDPVRLAPDMLAWLYVPTAAERAGDFSQAAAVGQMLDPLTGFLFPGGIIPLSRMPDPFVWRVALSGPATGEGCVPVPANMPRFTASYYVTGRNAQSDRLVLSNTRLIGTVYRIGDPFPPEQAVTVNTSGLPLDFHVSAPAGGSVDPGRWLKITPTGACCRTPSVIRVGIQPVGLPAGFYASTVSISPLGALGSPLSVDIGVQVQAPPNWVTTNPNVLQFSYRRGGPLPPTRSFAVTLAPGRAYVVNARVVSPTGGNWLGISPASGVGPGSIGVSITDGARNLGPGTYLAVVDVVASAPTVVLPRVFGAGGLSTETQPACGGGLTMDRVMALLDIDDVPMTTNPPLPRDPDTGKPLITVAYTQGGALAQPPPITFQPVQNTSLNGTFDVKTVVRSPDPASLPAANWLSASPTSSGLPAIVAPILQQGVVASLTACSYEGFVAISNQGAGAVIKLAFNVSGGGASVGSVQPTTRVIAHVADGGGWKTSVILVNSDQSNAANFQLQFHPGKKLNGDPIPESTPFNLAGTGAVDNRIYKGTIPAGGSMTLPTAGPDAPFWQGWAELSAPESVGGTAIFTQKLASDENSDAEGAVLVKPAAGRTFFLPFDNNQDAGLITTMALVNTSAAKPANISVKFRDLGGTVFATGSIPLDANGHEAFALPARFSDVVNRQGVAEFTSDEPDISGLGLRFNARQSTFTSFEILTVQSGGTQQAIAHVPDGRDMTTGAGGDSAPWKTSITLVNLDPAQRNTVTVRFRPGQDTPADQVLVLEGNQPVTTGALNIALDPGASTTIRTSGRGDVPLWRGWAEVNSSAALGGFAVFQQILSQTRQLEGTVSLTPLGGNRFLMPFDSNYITGLAFANPAGQPTTVTASFRDNMGREISAVPAGSKSYQLGALRHSSFGLTAPTAPLGGPGLTGYMGGGVADFSSSSPGLIGIGLRFSNRNAFTSLPILQR